MTKPKNNYYMHGNGTIATNENLFVLNSVGDTSLHKHDFIELVYFKSGVGKHYVEGKTYNVSNGSICLINANVEHYYEIKNEKTGSISVKNCIFYPSLFSKNYDPSNFIAEIWHDLFPLKNTDSNPINHIHITDNTNKDYFFLMNIIEHEFTNKHPRYMSVIVNCLTSIFIKLFRDYFQENTTNSISLRHIELIESSLFYIANNYSHDLTLNKIAQVVHLSPIYYNSLLKKYTGMSFRKYLQKLRCEKACELLETTDQTVSSIAEQIGYLDIKQFFLLFKRHTETTPLKYRQQKQKIKTIKN